MSFPPRTPTHLHTHLSLALSPSPNGRFLTPFTEPETPFFWLGDTAWELFHRLDEKEVRLFLNDRREKGFNVVMVVLMAEHGGLDYPARNGHFPFLPLPPTPEAVDGDGKPQYRPDITKPDPVFFAWVDEVIAIAAEMGIRIALVPTWGRYVNGGYYGTPILFTAPLASSYGKFLGQRYPLSPFILGGDSNTLWSPLVLSTMGSNGDLTALTLEDTSSVWEAMAAGILEGAKETLSAWGEKGVETYEPFMTYHSAQMWHPSAPISTSSAQFPNSDWLSLDCCQTGHSDLFPTSTPSSGEDGEISANQGLSTSSNPLSKPGLFNARSPQTPLRAMYAAKTSRGGSRPVIDLEPHYEDTYEFFKVGEGAKVWDGGDMRRGAWQSLCEGSCGLTYGCNAIWQMHNPESKTHPPIALPTTAQTAWFNELSLPGALYYSLAQKIILSLPSYFLRIPDHSFITSPRHERAEGGGDAEILGMRVPGVWAGVYLPFGGEVRVDVGRALGGVEGVEGALGEKGAWRGWWIDPRTGGREAWDSGKVQVGKGEMRFVRKEGGVEDWLLYLERV